VIATVAEEALSQPGVTLQQKKIYDARAANLS
jgi:hypothetical protein